MFDMYVYFNDGTFTRVSSEKLIELDAVLRGIAIVNRKAKCVESVCLEGDLSGEDISWK